MNGTSAMPSSASATAWLVDETTTGPKSTGPGYTTGVATDGDYEDGEFVFDDYVQRCIVASIFLLVSLLGIFGNGLVILAVALSRKLRTATNVFVVNLAVADLLTCLSLPFNALGLLTRPALGWPLPDGLCVALALVAFTCVGCSVYTLATIALNRWMLITRPARTYRACYRPVCLASMTAAVWLFPFLVTFLPPALGLGELGYTRKYGTCTHKNSHPLAAYYSLLQSVLLFPGPFAVIVVCYVKIFRHVRSHTRTMTKEPPQSGEMSETSAVRAERSTAEQSRAPGNSSSGSTAANAAAAATPTRRKNMSVAKRRLSRRQVEITKNLFYVVCAFAVCIAPHGVALLVPPSDPIIPWTAALLLINSCINPFIYATKHPHFKLIFGHILRCRCRQIPEQSDFLRSMRSKVSRVKSKN